MFVTYKYDSQNLIQPCKTIFTNIEIHRISKQLIIACITVLIEQKFTHQCSRVGHIEDVVTDNNYRGKGLGKLIVDYDLLMIHISILRLCRLESHL